MAGRRRSTRSQPAMWDTCSSARRQRRRIDAGRPRAFARQRECLWPRRRFRTDRRQMQRRADLCDAATPARNASTALNMGTSSQMAMNPQPIRPCKRGPERWQLRAVGRERRLRECDWWRRTPAQMKCSHRRSTQFLAATCQCHGGGFRHSAKIKTCTPQMRGASANMA